MSWSSTNIVACVVPARGILSIGGREFTNGSQSKSKLLLLTPISSTVNKTERVENYTAFCCLASIDVDYSIDVQVVWDPTGSYVACLSKQSVDVYGNPPGTTGWSLLGSADTKGAVLCLHWWCDNQRPDYSTGFASNKQSASAFKAIISLQKAFGFFVINEHLQLQLWTAMADTGSSLLAFTCTPCSIESGIRPKLLLKRIPLVATDEQTLRVAIPLSVPSQLALLDIHIDVMHAELQALPASHIDVFDADAELSCVHFVNPRTLVLAATDTTGCVRLMVYKHNGNDWSLAVASACDAQVSDLCHVDSASRDASHSVVAVLLCDGTLEFRTIRMEHCTLDAAFLTPALIRSVNTNQDLLMADYSETSSGDGTQRIFTSPNQVHIAAICWSQTSQYSTFPHARLRFHHLMDSQVNKELVDAHLLPLVIADAITQAILRNYSFEDILMYAKSICNAMDTYERELFLHSALRRLHLNYALFCRMNSSESLLTIFPNRSSKMPLTDSVMIGAQMALQKMCVGQDLPLSISNLLLQLRTTKQIFASSIAQPALDKVENELAYMLKQNFSSSSIHNVVQFKDESLHHLIPRAIWTLELCAYLTRNAIMHYFPLSFAPSKSSSEKPKMQSQHSRGLLSISALLIHRPAIECLLFILFMVRVLELQINKLIMSLKGGMKMGSKRIVSNLVNNPTTVSDPIELEVTQSFLKSIHEQLSRGRIQMHVFAEFLISLDSSLKDVKHADDKQHKANGTAIDGTCFWLLDCKPTLPSQQIDELIKGLLETSLPHLFLLPRDLSIPKNLPMFEHNTLYMPNAQSSLLFLFLPNQFDRLGLHPNHKRYDFISKHQIDYSSTKWARECIRCGFTSLVSLPGPKEMVASLGSFGKGVSLAVYYETFCQMNPVWIEAFWSRCACGGTWILA